MNLFSAPAVLSASCCLSLGCIARYAPLLSSTSVADHSSHSNLFDNTTKIARNAL